MTPAEFHILLALSTEPKHGLGIADDIDRVTEGDLMLGPGTLYRTLKTLAREGLVEETSSPTPDDDPRRKYYRISASGATQLSAQAKRMARTVRIATQRHVIPIPEVS